MSQSNSVSSPTNISVKRRNFYHGPNQSLLFREDSPPEDHEHKHTGCNCTKMVSTKPEGKPDTQDQEFYFLSEGFEFPLTSGAVTFGRLGDPDGHAYFWYRLPKETTIQVEITLPGYGLVDHFFATVLKGNKIDGSRLYMGHSSSKIFDPSKVDPNAIYVYGSGFGPEALRYFEDPKEIALWNETFRLVSFVQSRVAAYAEDYTTPVDVIRSRLEEDQSLLDACVATRELLAPIVTNLRKTELFRVGDEVDQECKRLELEERQRRDRLRSARDKNLKD